MRIQTAKRAAAGASHTAAVQFMRKARRGVGRTGRIGSATGARRRGFTLLELVLAMTIFSMVVAAIYSTYSAILRVSKAGADAAADLQRSRIASRTIEDALVSAVMFPSNPALYAFLGDGRGDFALLSFVARLPPSFPGSGYFGDQMVRRVTFSVEAAPSGGNQLVLHQVPLLQTNVASADEHTIVLARDVHSFLVEFAQQRGNSYEWVTDWLQTNQMPQLARLALAFGKPLPNSNKPRELTVRTVSIASVAVPRDSQLPPAAIGRPTGPVPPGQGPGTPNAPVNPLAPGAPGGGGAGFGANRPVNRGLVVSCCLRDRQREPALVDASARHPYPTAGASARRPYRAERRA